MYGAIIEVDLMGFFKLASVFSTIRLQSQLFFDRV
jgi:hypothetical protein